MQRLLLIGALLLVARVASAGGEDPWLGRDKALHFGATSLLGGGGYLAAGLATDDLRLRLAAGLALPMAAGVAKELYDARGTGDASWKDLTWDGIGSATGALTAWAIETLWRAAWE